MRRGSRRVHVPLSRVSRASRASRVSRASRASRVSCESRASRARSTSLRMHACRSPNRLRLFAVHARRGFGDLSCICRR
ncbi:hypothetical protein GT019_18380 [Paenibacillus sp. T1]|uniref:Uncharacterized protein n=1 Tax=Paenibacillus glycinis TaxID=2697035 RepID=A0ABW9XU25_9BACL|nr:hypothetical protein [Paenibacillus glycinis]